MNTQAPYRPFYVAAKAKIAQWRADYDAEVKDWYENGDGRSPEWVDAGSQSWFDAENDDPSRPVNIGGRGYSFPHCIHGVSMWVDYDCACGQCEMGYSDVELAQGIARDQYRRFTWVMSAPSDLPSDVKANLVKWALEV